MPYVMLFTAIGLNFFMIVQSQRIQRKIFETVLFAILILFAGLRASHVGSDTPTYISYFNMADSLENFQLLALFIEPGYLAWIFLINIISQSSFAFLALTSLAQIVLLYRIYINSKNYIFLFVYVMLFYLNFHFNTIRVGFAVLWFLCYLTEQKKYLRAIFLLAAPLFHVSILFFYPFFVMKWRLKSIALALLIITGFSVFFLNQIQGFFDKANSYSVYLNDGGSGVSFLGLIFVLIIGGSLIFYRRLGVDFKISAILLMLIYAAKVSFPILYRLVFIAQVFYFFYLATDLNHKFLDGKKVIALWPIVGALFFLQVHAIVTEKTSLSVRVDSGELGGEVLDSAYLPYEFIWQDPKK